MQFKKIAIVTGGSSGIGAAICKLLADQGTITYNFDIVPSPQEGVQFIQCDVTSFEALNESVQKVFREHDHIDYVVANAGIHVTGSTEETSLEDLEKVIAVNLKGVFHTLKAAIPLLKKQKSGAVVVMGSDQSLIGKAKSAIYGATKGAVAQLTKSAAVDCAPFNVRVNCVCPGAIETPLYEEAVKVGAQKYGDGDVEKAKSKVKEKYPMHRIGQPEEVAKLVAFLLSDSSSFIAGSLVSVDGGYVAQ